MNEIKFRAWDSEIKKMHYQDDSIVFHISGGGYWTCADLHKNICLTGPGNKGKLMQYTDLKDRNGKEIYEGDICLIDTKRGREKTDIKFPDIWEAIGYREANNNLDMNLEIIGNIYEDSEILKTI